MDTITIIGLSASVLTGISLVPQLYKIVKEKKAENVSFPMLIVLFAGLGLWVWYGVEKEDLIIICSNSFSMLINMLIMIFAGKYK